jgi:uncharacterized protein YsxB (DUF464 family)
MVAVEVILDEAGRMSSCRVAGHSGAGPRGGDIVCASVSVLAKAALRTLSSRDGITVRGDAPERGSFWMTTECAEGEGVFLLAVTAFLVEGFSSVSQEYPDYCSLRIQTERRQQHGS